MNTFPTNLQSLLSQRYARFGAAAIGSVALLATACGTPTEPAPKSDPDGGTELTRPGAPILSVVAGDRSVTLSWEDVEDAESYVVYFGTGELDAASATRIDPATSPHVIDGLENGTEYLFAAAARNQEGEGPWSETVVATPTVALLPPSAPDDATATPADGQVTVSWSAVEGAEAYELFWSDASPINRDTATHVTAVTSPHLVTGLENGTTYFFAVIATNQAGESGVSNEASAAPAAAETVPQPPGNVVAVAGSQKVTVSWNPVASATSYDLLYTDENELTAEEATRLADVESPFVVDELEHETIYRFAVIARNVIGDSEPSAPASATTLPQPPHTPGEIVITPGDSFLTIKWTGDHRADAHDLYFGTETELTEANATIIENVTSPYELTGLVNNTRYYVRIRSRNAGGASELSREASAVPQAPQPPDPPAGVFVTAGNAAITVSWTGDPAADSHDLYYDTASPVTAANATRVEDVTSPHTLTGLVNGTRYYVALVSRNEAGASAFSDEVDATPLTAPDAPTGLSAVGGPREVTLDWTVPATAEFHTIYYREGAEPEIGGADTVAVSPVAPPYTVTGLVNGTTYHFAVVASNSAGDSAPTDSVAATPVETRPLVRGVEPLGAALAGGVEVTLTGVNFELGSDLRVYFGEVEATDVTIVSDEELTVVAPPAVASGWTELRVTHDLGEFVREYGFVYSPYPGAARIEHGLDIHMSDNDIAPGDFNEDGARDFAVITHSTVSRNEPGRIQIVFGDGKGGVLGTSFVLPQQNRTGEGLLAADLDGDGHLDLAAAHSSFVQVHYGDGSGGFTSSDAVSTGHPSALAAGDFDEDGKLELIVAHKAPGAASAESAATLLADSGDRDWSEVFALPLSEDQVAVVVGHFNTDEDDLLDFALVSDLASGIRVPVVVYLRDDSTIESGESFGFREGSRFETRRNAQGLGVVARDLDGDGRDDLAVATRNVLLLFQQDDGSFDTTEIDMGNVDLRNIHVADIDADALLDLVVTDTSRSELAVLYGDSPGTFLPPVGIGVSSTLVGGALADFNGDGTTDLLAVGGPSGAIAATWLLNGGSSRLAEGREALGSIKYALNPSLALAGELLDGKDAVALVGGWGTNAWIHLFEITEAGFGAPVSIAAGNESTSGDLADFDGDGDLDIVLNSARAAQVTVVTNPGVSATVTDFVMPSIVTALAAGDLDGDGYADLVLATPSSSLVHIGINDQSGGFTFSTVGVRANSVALGDFDLDGDLDVAFDDTQGVGFVWNDELTFTPGATSEWIGHEVLRVQTADVDDDGESDILALTEGDDAASPEHLVVFLNDGDGTWTKLDFEVGRGATECAVGDGNGDGVTDVLVTNRVTGTVSFLQGDGMGAFFPQLAFDGGGAPSGIALYDADLDGKPRIYVTGNHTRGSISVVSPRPAEK